MLRAMFQFLFMIRNFVAIIGICSKISERLIKLFFQVDLHELLPAWYSPIVEVWVSKWAFTVSPGLRGDILADHLHEMHTSSSN